MRRLGGRVHFLVGVTTNVSTMARLTMETAEHGDVVRFDFVDSYHMLSVKMMHTCEWHSKYG